MTSKLVKDLAQKLDQLKPAPNRRRLFEEVIQKALTEEPPLEDSGSQVFVVVDKATNAPFVVQPLVSLAVFGDGCAADGFAREQSEAVTVRAALISPSDAEQLSELRKAAEVSLDLLIDICDSRASQRLSAIGMSRIKSHIQDLRSVLHHLQKETQDD